MPIMLTLWKSLLVIKLLIFLMLVSQSVNASTLTNKLYNENTSQKAAPLLRLAVAANFAPAMTKLVADFSNKYHIKVQIISGASGFLFQQLMHGAPFDVFLSADALRPRMLVEANIARASSLQTYSVGSIALWSASWPIKQSLPSLNSAYGDLLNSNQRLAIANPQTAPYGQAAKQILVYNKLWQPLSKRLITGININQTFQQVRSQSVHFGLIAKSQLVQNDLVGINIPVCQHQPIIQQLVILKASKKQLVAKQFIDFLLSESSQIKLSKMGYQPVASLGSNQC